MDDDGTPIVNAANGIGDAVLRELYDHIRAGECEDWAEAALRGAHTVTPAAVETQLAHAWRRSERHHVLGVPLRTRVRLTSPGLVDELADDVVHAVAAAIDGQPTDDRLLAIGLIGALGQLPTALSFDFAKRHYDDLHLLVSNGIPPVRGLLDIVERFRWTVKTGYDHYFHLNAG